MMQREGALFADLDSVPLLKLRFSCSMRPFQNSRRPQKECHILPADVPPILDKEELRVQGCMRASKS